VDRDAEALARAAGQGIVTRQADLEGGPWPYHSASFEGIVVCNYLWRPLLPRILEALAPRGILIYETFAAGNECYGRPSNPDFLLRPGELLEAVRGRLAVVAFEQGFIPRPKPAVVQRICAVNAEGEYPIGV
jgi:SAM-dependent methyltransferase